MYVKIDDVAITARVKENSLSIVRNKSKKRSLSVSIWYKASDTFPSLGQDIKVFEDTAQRFGGIISTIKKVGETPQQGTDASILLQITSIGYNTIPQRRTIAADYTDQTCSYIVNDVVTRFLGDEGVTIGTVNTGATITYQKTIVSIKTLLDDLAVASGYEWNIDDDKGIDFLTVSSPNVGTHSIIEGDRSVYSVKYNKTLTNYANKVFCIWDGNITVAEDTTEIASRQAIEGGTGVYGYILTDNSITNEIDATAAATEYLNRAKNEGYLTFNSYTRYSVGETLKVTYPKLGIVADTYFYIISRTSKRKDNIWVYSYSLEERDITDFSGKSKNDGADYFAKLMSSSSSSSSGNDIYVQDDEPLNATSSALWVDTNDYSRYGTIDYSTDATLDVKDNEAVFVTGTTTITLFTAVDHDGVIVILTNDGTGVIMITPDGTETINGASTYSLASQYDTVTLICHNSNWTVI